MKYLKITKVKYIKDFILQLTFSDNKIVDVDFYQFLTSSNHPQVTPFLNLKKFKTYQLNNGELMWGDFDLIFPIADLYKGHLLTNLNSKNKKVS